MYQIYDVYIDVVFVKNELAYRKWGGIIGISTNTFSTQLSIKLEHKLSL